MEKFRFSCTCFLSITINMKFQIYGFWFSLFVWLKCALHSCVPKNVTRILNHNLLTLHFFVPLLLFIRFFFMQFVFFFSRSVSPLPIHFQQANTRTFSCLLTRVIRRTWWRKPSLPICKARQSLFFNPSALQSNKAPNNLTQLLFHYHKNLQKAGVVIGRAFHGLKRPCLLQGLLHHLPHSSLHSHQNSHRDFKKQNKLFNQQSIRFQPFPSQFHLLT